MSSVDFTHIFKRLERMTAEVEKEVAGALFVGGLKIEENAKKSIQDGNKTGRIYQRGNVTHRASAPGEAPASDTGELAYSGIKTIPKSSMHVNVEAQVVSKSKNGSSNYAIDLEYGTSKMEARPFMKPAFDVSKEFIIERMEKALKRAVQKNAK